MDRAFGRYQRPLARFHIEADPTLSCKAILGRLMPTIFRVLAAVKSEVLRAKSLCGVFQIGCGVSRSDCVISLKAK